MKKFVTFTMVLAMLLAATCFILASGCSEIKDIITCSAFGVLNCAFTIIAGKLRDRIERWK